MGQKFFGLLLLFAGVGVFTAAITVELAWLGLCFGTVVIGFLLLLFAPGLLLLPFSFLTTTSIRLIGAGMVMLCDSQSHPPASRAGLSPLPATPRPAQLPVRVEPAPHYVTSAASENFESRSAASETDEPSALKQCVIIGTMILVMCVLAVIVSPNDGASRRTATKQYVPSVEPVEREVAVRQRDYQPQASAETEAVVSAPVKGFWPPGEGPSADVKASKETPLVKGFWPSGEGPRKQ